MVAGDERVTKDDIDLGHVGACFPSRDVLDICRTPSAASLTATSGDGGRSGVQEREVVMSSSANVIAVAPHRLRAARHRAGRRLARRVVTPLGSAHLLRRAPSDPFGILWQVIYPDGTRRIWREHQLRAW